MTRPVTLTYGTVDLTFPVFMPATCPACGATGLQHDDMNGPDARLIERYGANVCWPCADAHRNCEWCNRAITLDESVELDSGWHCAECAADPECAADDARLESAIYRRSV